MGKIKFLNVYPNPFHALDHLGRPAGVLPNEPEGDGIHTFDSRAFVGARLRTEITYKPNLQYGLDASHQRQDTQFDYTEEPVTVKNTPYYRSALQRRELLPADEYTALTANVPWKEIEEALEDEREMALTRWQQQAHEEHEDDDEPEALMNFHFGPMPKAIEARKVAAKAAAEAEKNETATQKKSTEEKERRRRLRAEAEATANQNSATQEGEGGTQHSASKVGGGLGKQPAPDRPAGSQVPTNPGPGKLPEGGR